MGTRLVISTVIGLAWCFVLLGPLAAETPDFVVAPGGSDQGPGTADKPFATIARAREAVRERIAAGLEADVLVLIRGGTYYLDQTLVFGSEDSGTAEHSVTYAAAPGEEVVVSGGRAITGWSRGEGGVWTARVADPDPQNEGFRNLFVDGRRAVRARTPNVDEEPNCRQLVAASLAADHSRFTLTLPPGILGPWRNASDVEVMIAGNWAVNRKRVQSVDAESNVLVLAPPHRPGPAYIFPKAGRWFYLENARELLDQPGEWHLDRPSGVLSYRPRDGEDMTDAAVVAPRLTQLLVVTGTPEKPVRNVHFRGIRFEHTDWQLPADGYMGIQACHHSTHTDPGRRWHRIPGAVQLTWADGCSVEGGAACHLGTSGIAVLDGCHDCVVRGNHVFDVSANGVMVGGPNREEEVPRANRVENNHVHACGREYYGAIGIWVGFAQGAAVSHNEVHDLPYTGISVGWQWNPEPTACKENLIEANHVFHVMNRLCDGGCIYTLGYQPGTVIRGNHLHDVHRSTMAQGAPNNGMFIDQGSKGYLFERNVIYRTSAADIRFNQCSREWHTWKDNYLGEEAAATDAARQIIAAAGLEQPK